MKLSLENRTQSITSACLRTGRLVPSSTPPVARRGARAPALLRRPRSPSSNPSIVAAALLLPALPSSPERSSHPAVKSHRFVSNVQGTERSRVRQCACSSSFERGSRILLVRSQATPKHRSRTPGTAQGLEKQHPCSSPYLQSNIHSCFTDTRSQCFPTGKGRHSHVQSERSAFLSHFSFTNLQAPCVHSSAEALNFPLRWGSIPPVTEPEARGPDGCTGRARRQQAGGRAGSRSETSGLRRFHC